MAELTNLGGAQGIDIALDLTVVSADEALSTVIDAIALRAQGRGERVSVAVTMA